MCGGRNSHKALQFINYYGNYSLMSVNILWVFKEQFIIYRDDWIGKKLTRFEKFLFYGFWVFS